jgi:predicted transcriptional regulator
MREDAKRQRDEAEYDAWFRRQVQAGLDSANAGNLIPADHVEAALAARRPQTRRRLAESTS